MNVFEEVKTKVTVRQAADQYGVRVGRNNKALCPFHNDKHPSLLIKEDHYHCFGCGVGGDVVDFTARLFGLSQIDAARKLAEDFSIPLEGIEKRYRLAALYKKETKKQRQEKRIRELSRRFENWKEKTYGNLVYYRDLLNVWKEIFKPETEEEEWHPLFCEALEKLTLIEDRIDLFLFGDLKEQIEFYLNCREEMEFIEKRIHETGSSYNDKSGDGNEGSGRDNRRDSGEPAA